jgi:hypothetical protein
LQRALNVIPSKQAKLAEDSQFGPKTRGRVMEFQGQKHVAQDGVVGPVTWGQLEPFVKQILQMVDQTLPVNPDEEALRQRIVDVAKTSLATWGWGDSGPVVPDGSPRIAAARGFGPFVGDRCARQGGVALASIYAMAGAGGSLCMTITSEMLNVYQQDPKKHPKRRDTINQKDIGSWCGIFATYCYRAAGLKVSWNEVKHQMTDYFEIIGPTQAARKGDIGVYDTSLNHHFLVIEDAAPGKHVYSIDGNVGNPAEKDVTPWNSVIAKRFYLRSTLASRAGRFLRPKFAAMR